MGSRLLLSPGAAKPHDEPRAGDSRTRGARDPSTQRQQPGNAHRHVGISMEGQDKLQNRNRKIDVDHNGQTCYPEPTTTVRKSDSVHLTTETGTPHMATEQPTTSKKRRRKSPDIPDSKLVELRAQGMSLEQVGKVVGMTKQAVHLRLKRYNIDPNELAEFKRQKPDILDAAQAKMIEAVLDPEVISKANLLQRATTFAILFDKHRLQTNQSTSNLAVSGSLSQLRQRAHQSRMADYAAEAGADSLLSPAVDARETAYRDTVAAHNHDNE